MVDFSYTDYNFTHELTVTLVFSLYGSKYARDVTAKSFAAQLFDEIVLFDVATKHNIPSLQQQAAASLYEGLTKAKANHEHFPHIFQKISLRLLHPLSCYPNETVTLFSEACSHNMEYILEDPQCRQSIETFPDLGRFLYPEAFKAIRKLTMMIRDKQEEKQRDVEALEAEMSIIQDNVAERRRILRVMLDY